MNETTLNKKRLIGILYWTIPVILFFAQLLFTINSLNQIRYEELAESVRNVFWLQKGLIYDGISSNVGWYGLLLIVYNIFGFGLNSAKFVRLIIQLLSLFSLTALLNKYLGFKKAWLPLLAIGLSPTLLYFNTLQTSYGIDLNYLIISVYILTKINFNNGFFDEVKQGSFWFFNMIAWLSYPTFIFYLPSLTILYFWRLSKKVNGKLLILKKLLLNMLYFLLPVIVILLYLKNPNTLLYDPIAKSGIFRGAGMLTFNLNIYYNNLAGFLKDLFYKGSSYNFELAKADFSGFYPVITLITVFITSIFLFFKEKEYRRLILLVYITLIFTLLFANLTFDPTQRPGLRRDTPILASVYALFTITWFYISSKKFKTWIKWSFLIIYLLLPIHNFMVYPYNLEALGNPSAYQYRAWFGTSDTPSDSLEMLVDRIKVQDLSLSCETRSGKPTFCRYNETYAAVAGTCLWNKLTCKSILGYDGKQQKFIPISTKLWENYYWEH